MNLWKISTFVLAALLVIVVSFSAVQRGQAEPQPRMQAALDALLTAKENLEKATHDKGGHRVKALGLVNKAIVQVKKGIQFDNKRSQVDGSEDLVE